MMATPYEEENHPPEFYAGKGDTKLTPAFKSFANELGDEFGPRALAIKDLVKGRFARTRLKHLFDLTDDQFDAVLTEAGASEAWRPRFEETFGFTFAKVNYPPSANLITQANKVRPPEGRRIETKTNTLSAELGEDACKRCVPPQFIWDAVKVASGEILEEGQFGLLATLWILWIFAKTGKTNVGIQLVRLHARIFRAHFPHLSPIGSGLKTPARERDWEDVLSNKTSLWQRKDIMVGPSVCGIPSPTAELCVN
tara:strand:- start:1557 stop:2318 length:762 start_codon:yes stop_codon:yes gene_type:complete